MSSVPLLDLSQTDSTAQEVESDGSDRDDNCTNRSRSARAVQREVVRNRDNVARNKCWNLFFHNVTSWLSTIEGPASTDKQLVEDCRLKPSPQWDPLPGRVASSYSGCPISVDWFFQRFVNQFMRLLLNRASGDNWYNVSVDEAGFTNTFYIAFTIFMMPILSPITFALIYPITTVALLVLLPYAIIVLPYTPRRRDIGREELHDMFQRKVNSDEFLHIKYADFIAEERKLYDGAKHHIQKGEAYVDRVRKRCLEDLVPLEPKLILHYISLLFQCAWLGWLSVLPWVYYVVSGDLALCNMDLLCDDSEYHLSWLSVMLPWLACVITAFCYTQHIAVTACVAICALEQNRRVKKHQKYTKCINIITKKLSDPKDRLSFFPTFSSAVGDRFRPTRLSMHIFIAFASLLLGFLPPCWMQGFYSEDPRQATPIVLVVILTSSFGYTFACWGFLIRHENILTVFAFVVDQAKVLTYLTARSEMKKQPTLHGVFEKAASRNDKVRKEYFSEIVNNQQDRFDKAGNGNNQQQQQEQQEQQQQQQQQRTGEKAQNRMDAFSRTKTCETRLHLHLQTTTEESQDELTNLHEHGIVFNFHTPEGLMLYRSIREWLEIECLNDRTGAELFVTITSVYILCSAVLVILCYEYYDHTITCISFHGVISALLMMIFMVRSLNLCVAANEFFFMWPPRLMFEWKDALWSGMLPFHGDRSRAAWIWDTSKNAMAWLQLDRTADFDLACSKFIDSRDDLDANTKAKGDAMCKKANDTMRNADADKFTRFVHLHLGSSKDSLAGEMIEDSDARTAASECLTNQIKHMESYQKRQTILGLPITSALRTKIILSLGTVLAPLLVTVFKETTKYLTAVVPLLIPLVVNIFKQATR
eukprot:NODE_678_length_2843_cov_5.631811.p1 GENE.NODE_678_length_2843_cov_5.631811~~NODE_678_length_2843_cov_5.631811.p1  ORF type:complete len:874 (+),score=215.84 NODE_678_length_2843_cov_5.631811:192-2813(+)